MSLAALLRRVTDWLVPSVADSGKLTTSMGNAEASRERPCEDTGARLDEQIIHLVSDVLQLRASLAQIAGDLSRTLDQRHRDPRSVARARGQVFSQNDEDGIIAEVLSRIGASSRIFVEIGVGSGVENNTRLLLETGWTGLWLEGDPTCASTIRTILGSHIEAGRLSLVQTLVTRDNVTGLVDGYLNGREIDLLSIDIDHNTSYVWAALRHLRPRLTVVEYNAHFPPHTNWEIPYDPQGSWRGTVRFGASLKALERIGSDMGYRLVGCDLNGVNAFFVRADLVDERTFLPPFTAERHYEPPRFEFVRMRGHPRHTGPLDQP